MRALLLLLIMLLFSCGSRNDLNYLNAQAKCSKDSDAYYLSRWKSSDVPSYVRERELSKSYSTHYSLRQGKCFIEVVYDFTGLIFETGDTSVVSTISVADVYGGEQNQIALYSDKSETFANKPPKYQVEDCYIDQMKTCKSRDEFKKQLAKFYGN